jgi:hypothetical protein
MIYAVARLPPENHGGRNRTGAGLHLDILEETAKKRRLLLPGPRPSMNFSPTRVLPGLAPWLFVAALGADVSPALAAPPEPANPAAGRVVMLPPIFVAEPRLAPPPWHYANLPGMEFLSSADDVTTGQLIERVYQLHQKLDVFLPSPFRVKFTVPVSYILYGEAQEMVDLKDFAAGPHPAGGAGDAAALTLRYLPNFRFWEQDELAVFFLLQENAAGTGNIYLNPAYLRYAMETRTPPLPRWFIDGMMALYRNSAIEVAPIYSGFSRSAARSVSVSGHSDPDATGSRLPYGSVLVRLPGEMLGPDSALPFDKDARGKIRLPPLSSLFATPPPPGARRPEAENDGEAPTDEKERRYAAWWSQSALFIHWALHRDGGEGRAAFWKFVARASVEPVSEALFRQHFGLGYAEADKILAGYFRTSAGTAVQLDARDAPALPAVNLRPASKPEISRLKGNLERLEIAYVREKYPALAPRYLAQARHTLRQAYDHGDHEAGLLEALGLCECDASDDAAARPFLEAAVKAGAKRPRVYYELARITYQALRAQDSATRLSASHTAELLELLFSARAHPPPLPQVYELIAAVWLQSAVAPTRGNLAVLDEGLQLYPGNLQLIYLTAVVAASYGWRDAATRLVGVGLQRAPEGPDRLRFLKLQSALGDAPARGR